MLSANGSPYSSTIDLSEHMNPKTPGLFTTYPGENVTITYGFWYTITIFGNYWTVRGNEGGILRLINTNGFFPVTSTADLGITLGPDVEIVLDTISEINGAHFTSSAAEGILIEGVKFETTGGATFTQAALYASFQNDTKPMIFPQRLIVRGCEFVESGYGTAAIRLRELGYAIVESNYIPATTGDIPIELRGVSHVSVQNNIIYAMPDTASTLALVLIEGRPGFNASKIVIQHNTFVCQVSSSNGLIFLFGNGNEYDPREISVLNNLFSGPCGDIIADSVGCTLCLGDASSILGCNRGSLSPRWYAAGSNWIDRSGSCADSLLTASIDFEASGNIPVPYFEVTTRYSGEPTSLDFDFVGNPRVKPFPTMGALELQFDGTCNGIPADSPDVCNYGNGTCYEEDECYCFDNWENQGFGECNDFKCEDGIFFLLSGASPCSGHGYCTPTDSTCVCTGNYADRFGFCDGYFCQDGNWRDSPDACSGHGNCTLTNSECICESPYVIKVVDDDTLYCETCEGPCPVSRGEGWWWLYVYIGSGVGSGLILVGLILLVLICLCCCCCCCRKGEKGISHEATGREHDLKPRERGSSNARSDGIADATLEVDLSRFTIDPSNIELLQRVGQGGGGAVVFRAKWRGQTVAYKLWTMSQMGNEELKLFEKEIGLASSLHHPNIVRFFGVTIDKPKLGLLMEFCDAELGVFLKTRVATGDPVSFRARLGLAHGIALGLAYLHSREIIHRDIKPANILIDSNMVPKLVDFGLSRVVACQMTTRIGTPGYMAPEIVLGLQYGTSVDLFSFGILLYAMVTLEWFPYGVEAVAHGKIDFRVANDENYRPSLEDTDKFVWNPRIARLCRNCWAHDSNSRLTADAVAVELEKICSSL